MKRSTVIVVILTALAVVIGFFAILSNSKREIPGKEQGPEELVIYSAHPLELLRPLVREFEARTGILVKVVSGGTGMLIDQIEAEAQSGQPVADILWSGSLSTLKPHTYLFEEYTSPNEDFVHDKFKNDDGVLTRFSIVPSILMVNTDLVGDIEINGYQDLLNPLLKGKIAYCNPSVSSSAFEHLINMLYAMGNGVPEAGWEYVKQLCKNLDGHLLSSSTEVYQGVTNGKYVVGLIFEDAAVDLAQNGAHIRIVYMEEGVVTTPDIIAIVKNAPHGENARLFLDFATSYEVQTMLVTKLNRRSVRVDVPAPKNLKPEAEFNVLTVDIEKVNKLKRQWIYDFLDMFLDASDSVLQQ